MTIRLKMMKSGIIIFGIFIIVCGACKSGNKKPWKTMIKEKDGKETYFYKVDGLQDSIVSDSIWKIIFQFQGVDKLVLSKSDSSAVFTIDPKSINGDAIAKEITKRGGKLLN
jgi:hypothetical protein